MNTELKYIKHNGHFLNLKDLKYFKVYENLSNCVCVEVELSLRGDPPYVFNFFNTPYSDKARDWIFNLILHQLNLPNLEEIDLNRIERLYLETLEKND